MATLIINSDDSIGKIIDYTIRDMDVVVRHQGHTTDIIKGPFHDELKDTSTHLERLEEFMDVMNLWDRYEEFLDAE